MVTGWGRSASRLGGSLPAVDMPGKIAPNLQVEHLWAVGALNQHFCVVSSFSIA